MPFDGTQLSEATRTLIEGKRRIEKGWCQGVWSYEDRVCMSAAIAGTTKYCHQSAAARLYLCEVIGTPYLVAWNDKLGRTKEEVLAAFDRAIELSMRN